MTILFPDTSSPGNGKGFFLQLLEKTLKAHGAEIVHDDKYDVAFENIRFKHEYSKPVVLRLNGVYHNTAMNWEDKNASLAESAKKAKLIICQSSWGYRMVMKYLKVPPSKVTIILNGADLNAETTEPEYKHKHNFMAATVWRPHKRLVDIIESFLLADIRDSCLRIFGKLGKGMTEDVYKYRSNKVIFMEQVKDRAVLLGHMKNSTALLHLCMTDCCPNSVVEAVSQGCHVVCSNEGGTPEIVYPSGGSVVEIDEPYNMEPIDLYNPPEIDRGIVAEAMTKVAEMSHLIVQDKPVIENAHVDINFIAEKYLEVFKRAVCCL